MDCSEDRCHNQMRIIGALMMACWMLEPVFEPAIAWSQHQHQTQTATAKVGAAAIGFQVKLLDGTPISLESFRGKPLVMNFFASWCDPCREEMPLINDLASKAGKGGYSILGIAVEDTRAAVREYANEAKLAFPVALDLDSTVKRSYRIFGPPATFFIDSKGVIRDVILGPMTVDRAREALKKISGSM